MINNNTYILSLSSADIYSHMVRDGKIIDNFCGMIPYSLELIKLKSDEIGMKVKVDKITGKETSRDIINIKFRNKVNTGYHIIEATEKKIIKCDKIITNENNKLTKLQVAEKIIEAKSKPLSILDVDKLSKIKANISKCDKKIQSTNNYIDKLNEFVASLNSKQELDDSEKTEIFSHTFEKVKNEDGTEEDKVVAYTTWDEISNQVLREYLYKNGFVIKTTTKSGKIKEEKYVVYKRSGSKSRTGQCLFIKEKLRKPMIDWSRMNLPFIEGMAIDYAGLLAYESLVGSHLEKLVTINPKNILIVDDVLSKFKKMCNVIRKNDDTDRLDSFEEEYEVSNSLFDGESILESAYFPEDKSMMLLRHHMFKSASFSGNIQLYLKDNCPDGIEYDKWEIKNMFNEVILAKDVHMIFCPTSLKALKFSKWLNMSEQDIWTHWKKTVEAEGCNFGVCKHEKESKRGKDNEGNIIQQTSYQMVNSLNFQIEDMIQLTQFERDYVARLKNDDQFFLQYALDNANAMNSNKMLVEIAKRNSDFMNVEMFRNFRTSEISAHVTHCKRGKIRLNGDYNIILGNCLEFLQHAIGKLKVKYVGDKILEDVNVEELPLKGNEIYTKLHDFNLDLVCMRNPHTSPSNVLIARNKYVEDIEKYFNLNNLIVCVCAIKFPIQDILSSMDYDSDSMVIFNNETLLRIAEDSRGKYNICINGVIPDNKPYTLTNKDMCAIDNQLANSQRNIGEVVNLAQLCLSTYWDLLADGYKVEALSELLKKVDVMTILSGIAIDLAKKFYLIDIEKEIKNVSSSKFLRIKENKPLFWKYVKKTKKKKAKKKDEEVVVVKKEIIPYKCPMDFLNITMSKLPYPVIQHKGIGMESVLVRGTIRNEDWGQEQKILKYVRDLNNELKSINASVQGGEDWETEEMNNEIDNAIKHYKYYINKLTIKDDTMMALLRHMVLQEKTDIQTKLMNILFSRQKDTFLNSFIKKDVKIVKKAKTYFEKTGLLVGFRYVKRFPYEREQSIIIPHIKYVSQ